MIKENPLPGSQYSWEQIPQARLSELLEYIVMAIQAKALQEGDCFEEQGVRRAVIETVEVLFSFPDLANTDPERLVLLPENESIVCRIAEVWGKVEDRLRAFKIQQADLLAASAVTCTLIILLNELHPGEPITGPDAEQTSP